MGFPRCRDVHTLTMRHPLDVAFLDRRGRVIAVHRLVLPGARLRCGRAWAVVERFARPELLPLDGLAPGEVVFAVGNIAQGGRDIMARVRQEGTLYVQ